MTSQIQMKVEKSYMRVGVNYYKIVEAPTIAGQVNEILVSWNIETIRQDHGKTYLASNPKFDGFTCIPDHLNFQSTYNNFYNTYSPLSHNVLSGDCPKSLDFVKHIFGDHYELGLDYLQLLSMTQNLI